MGRMRIICMVALLSAMASEATAKDTDDAAVMRMQALAEKYPVLVDSAAAIVSPPSKDIKEWYRRKVFVKDVGFDVRRTDSLVTPLIGYLTFSCAVQGTKGTSEEYVRSRPDNFSLDGDRCKATYAFQSGKWVHKDLACELTVLGPDYRFTRKWESISAKSKGIYGTCAMLLPQD